MTDKTLDQAQRLVDQLTPVEQVRLLAYVASRVAQVFPPGLMLCMRQWRSRQAAR
jgi:hypothetical protein